MTASADVQETTINTIRTLSMDAVQAANSGHPGTPMALAPVAYSLWSNFLNYDCRFLFLVNNITRVLITLKILV